MPLVSGPFLRGTSIQSSNITMLITCFCMHTCALAYPWSSIISSALLLSKNYAIYVLVEYLDICSDAIDEAAEGGNERSHCGR